ncbi:MAG: hypothetical protein GY803_26415 [Chloroflexi bacterium]|nr:hypothetical protein [Chloroflexota bacterium]
MNADDFTYKSQDVNYLGFLEAQLRDLHGIDTLAYELIQNADDAMGDDDGRFAAAHLSFNITDEALIVENDGVFRPVDFERLQSIASGGKRDEIGVTGAFGLGFIAVYQVTDRPEIFSDGRHWIISPDALPERRIQERRVKTEATRFRLPWAFDESSLIRRTLRLEAIRPDQLDEFADRISAAVEPAALFLKQLQTLIVQRNGNLVKRIERIVVSDSQLDLQDETGQTTTWLLFNGDFAAAAAQLRVQYPWQIEEKRHSQVCLALPTAGLSGPGRLFAVLPTDSTIPLPSHINADFFPTTDRKRIHFDSDRQVASYQAKWNRAAIECASVALAEQFDALPLPLGHVNLWRLLQKAIDAQQLAEQGELPDVFAAFWSELALLLPTKPIFYTADDEWRLPAEGRLLARGNENVATALLQSLQIPIAHPDLAPYFPLMRRPEIGASPLTVDDIARALVQMGLTRSTPLFAAPPFLRRLEAWQSLWQLIDALLNRLYQPEEKENALNALNQCALVLTENMMLERLNYVFRGQPEAKALFPDAAWLHESISPDAFPGRYAQQFGARQAVDLLTETPIHQLEQAWRLGQLDIPRLFRWFEARQIEIFADDPALQMAIRRLPLCPVAGELRPLADLYIPGRFEDPLKLAGIIDLDALDGRSQFLRDLGVQELDFETYIYEQMPRALAQYPDIPSDARHRLARLLAARLGEFRDDADLQAQLSRLPLVACLDGSFRPPTEVYASRNALALLGERIHIAEPVTDNAMSALHRWLGVRQRPTAEDVVGSLLAVAGQWGMNDAPLDTAVRNRVEQCWLRLNDLREQNQIAPETLEPLRDQKVVPNRRAILAEPTHRFIADQTELAASFAGLDDYLLPGDAGFAPVALIVGVRPLSQAVQLHILGAETAVPDEKLQTRIRDRRPVIERLLKVETTASPAADQTAFLDGLRVMKTPHLQTQYRLPVGDVMLTAVPETASVKLDVAAGILYIAADSERSPWTAVARELAQAIQQGPGGGLAIGIKEALTTATLIEANQILDELGYPL